MTVWLLALWTGRSKSEWRQACTLTWVERLQWKSVPTTERVVVSTHRSVGVCHGNLVDGKSLKRGVQCLRYEDRSSDGEVLLASDEGSSTEVCACLMTMSQCLRQPQKGANIDMLTPTPSRTEDRVIKLRLRIVSLYGMGRCHWNRLTHRSRGNCTCRPGLA